MSGLSDVFSFADYKQALSVQSMMAPGDVAMLQNVTLGALALGTVALVLISIVRRSGTAITGALLLASVAGVQAILYGQLDFLTDGMMVLASALTAAAALLFVNAVLHTAQGNRIVAIVSAVAIAAVIGLAGLTAGGLNLAAEASLAALIVGVVAVGLLCFAIQQDPSGNGILGFSMIMAFLAAILMTSTPAQFLDGFLATAAPVSIMTAGVLIAAITAPFVGEDLSFSFASRGREPVGAHSFAAGGSLFSDDDDVPQQSAVVSERRVFSDTPREPAPEPQRSYHDPDPVPSPAASFQAAPSEPVSSYWHQASAGGPMLDVAANEYVWDALAQPEVRAGQTILDACGAETSIELTPEGLRDRLSPEALALFDDQVLGGGEPVSGPFDVDLATQGATFRFNGRRQVDHDGILMRLDATIEDVHGHQPQAAPAATGFAAAAAVPQPQHEQPEPVATASAESVVRLHDDTAIGFEIDLRHCGTSADEVRDAVDQGAAQLAQMLADDARRGPFAVIDAVGLNVPPGTLASAIGKAVRAHDLPKGALLVALDPGINKKPNAIEAQATDIQRAGGGVALLLHELSSKAPKFQPNMLWISALDVPMGKNGPKKGTLSKVSKRLGAPVLVADIKDKREAADLQDAGATFGLGRAFKTTEPKVQSTPEPAPAVAPTLAADPETAPAPDRSGLQTSLRARGLR
ncbi:MAG: hypothetical protein AAFX52_08935 [Pseudomonadota bacterium]